MLTTLIRGRALAQVALSGARDGRAGLPQGAQGKTVQNRLHFDLVPRAAGDQSARCGDQLARAERFGSIASTKRELISRSANRAALSQHPWVDQIPVSEPPLSPNALRWMERGLRSFARTLLTEQEKLSSLLLIEVYVRGQVQLSTSFDVDDSGLAKREADERYVRRLAQLIDPDGFPAITAAVLSGSLQDESDFAEDEFRFGLRTVLDGIEALIERRTAAKRRR